MQRDYDAALPLFERALDVAPSNAAAWMWSSVTHSYLGDGTEALRRANLALRLSPRDWFGFQYDSALCLAAYTAGDYAAAIQAGRSCVAENPRYTSSALRYLAAALAAAGERWPRPPRSPAVCWRLSPASALARYGPATRIAIPTAGSVTPPHLRAAGVPESKPPPNQQQERNDGRPHSSPGAPRSGPRPRWPPRRSLVRKAR